MFGYVVPYKDELKVREYKLFRAFYCGLCKTLGKSSNQLTRFGLNYDFTFLALLLTALDEDEPQIKHEACIVNPFKKKPLIKKNQHLEYAADLNVIFVFLKLLDNWHDEHSFKSLLSMPVYYFASRGKREKYATSFHFFEKSLKKLEDLETAGNDIVDKSADVFARIMSVIFTPAYITEKKCRRILASLGYNLGRWIYILDAFSDLVDDINYKNYNPLLLQYNYSEAEGLQEFKDRIRENIVFTLTYSLNNLAKAYQLLTVHRYNNILENIIYLGLYQVMEKKLNNGGREIEKSIQDTGTE